MQFKRAQGSKVIRQTGCRLFGLPLAKAGDN